MYDSQNSNWKDHAKEISQNPLRQVWWVCFQQVKLTGLAWLSAGSPPLTAVGWGRWMSSSQLQGSSRNPLSAMRHKVGWAGFPSNWYKMVSNWLSLTTDDIENFFMLIGHVCLILWIEMSIHAFPPLSIGLFVLSLLIWGSSFYALDTNILLDFMCVLWISSSNMYFIFNEQCLWIFI